jgi:tRNA threonylcarbamoyladenosine biosynthesis protein TsaE
MKRTFETHSEEETIQQGGAFSRGLKRGDVVALIGDLGSGKTRFTKGICRELGVSEHVASPTFTIINEYAVNDLHVYHFDFYRVKSIAEILDLGFEEYINGDGICLIEWADKAQSLLPSDRYDVHFQLGATEHTRKITVEELRGVSA